MTITICNRASTPDSSKLSAMSALSPDVADHLALALVPGLGPKLTAALLARFGSPAAALRASAAELCDIPHIGDKLAVALAEAFSKVTTADEQQLLDKHAVHAVPLGFPGYPAPLARIAAPPPLLYFRGDWHPDDANAIGIVGSRSCTPYGVKAAGQLARGLVRAGFTVVSGLAPRHRCGGPSRGAGRRRPDYRRPGGRTGEDLPAGTY